MMYFAPKCIGNIALKPDELRKDREKCLRVGPCGIGRKAIYLGSLFIDCRYYVSFDDVRRVYKRVAMSKGGYSGKGTFGTMAYLVVVLSNGQEQACRFKFEDQVDRFIGLIAEDHPDIPTHSVRAEQKLRVAEAAEKAKYLKDLSPQAEASVGELRAAMDTLDEKPELAQQLACAAREKRTIDRINPAYQAFAGVVLAFAVCAVLFGFWAVLNHRGFAIYFVLFGFAFIFLISATRILPTARHNRRTVQRDYDEALRRMREFLTGKENFPVPAQYAHPVVLMRMIRAIRMGRAVTIPESLDVVKADLKALNSSVTVSQKEYDEVVVVKPLFLVMDYQ